MKAFLYTALLVFSGCSTRTPDAENSNGIALFDGKTLAGWKQLDFEGSGGAAFVSESGDLQIEAGTPISGIALDQPDLPMPEGDYELELEARIIDGDDFFCGLTFPIPAQQTCCTLIVGGWGGTLVGISSVNGMDAAHNHLSTALTFKPRQWYRIRVRVTTDYVTVWIDDAELLKISGEKRFSMRHGSIEQCQPIGLATYKTAAAYRNLLLREL